jgi:hypothetical protein
MWFIRTTQGFVEVYVVGSPLSSPYVLPERFVGRSHYCGKHTDNKDIYIIDSNTHTTPPLISKGSLRTHGLWIVPADARPMGGLNDNSIPDTASIFGLPIGHTEEQLIGVCEAGSLLNTFKPLRFGPSLVLYHGTSAASWSSIATQGLQMTGGMLGKGVYAGSFWKATRFAARNQDYIFRNEGGVIVRMYVFAENIVCMPAHAKAAYICNCLHCCESTKTTSAASLERAAQTDHESRWAIDPKCEGIYLPPRRCQSDPLRWIVRNAEWCLRASAILIQDAAFVDLTSIVQDRYDPLQRTQKIL